MKVIFKSGFSATFELENSDIFYAPSSFDVVLNGKTVIKNEKRNVFSIYDLEPNTVYCVKASNEKVTFTTDVINETIYIKDVDNTGKTDVNLALQHYILNAKENSAIVIEKGIYFVTSLFLKSNITLYLKKGAILSASTLESHYIEINGEETDRFENTIQRGSWEGSPKSLKAAIINCIDSNNVKIVGEGLVDGNAQLSTWWATFKTKDYARPNLIFINHSHDVFVQGINLKNSPQWTVHPYFSKNIGFYNVYIENPKISPNTDGINPECSTNVDIVGVHFSVGDDCIAIKSGKMYIGKKYKLPSSKITIRNCLMENGHGAVVLGSEMSGGIKDINVSRCIFSHTDRGLRIKTRRGRGDTAIIDDVTFSNILMEDVLSPLVINMFYFCDPDGKTEYVYSKEKLPVDDRTPYLGKFTFRNIKAMNCEYCVGYFYGLPEQPIGEINILDSIFSMKKDAGKGFPAMMSFAEECSKRGLIFDNVKAVKIKNCKFNNVDGKLIEARNVGEIQNE